MKARTIGLKEPQLVVSISDPSLVNKLKSAIQMLNGVSSISVLKPKKTELELAEEDVVETLQEAWLSNREITESDFPIGRKWYVTFRIQTTYTSW